MNYKILNKFARSLLFVVCVTIFQYVVASDYIAFEDGKQPHFENDDYEVWLMSVINDRDNTYINLSIYPKKRFRHYAYYKLKKSDRTDILCAQDIRLIELDSAGVIGVLPYVDCREGWTDISKSPSFYGIGNREYSANLNDKEINHLTLKFGGHLSPNVERISLLQNGDDRYFSFVEIPISIACHQELDNTFKTEKEIISLIDASNDQICGVYQEGNTRYACVLIGNTYKLICLDKTTDLVWKFGDIRASFNRTAVPGVYKGNYRFFVTKQWVKDFSFVCNGDLLEIAGKYLSPAIMGKEFFIPAEEKDIHFTYTKIYPTVNNLPTNYKEQWSGSGFALLNGYIVTNNHVADGASMIEIFGIDGDFTKGHKAKLIGKDKICDIALLQLEEISRNGYWESIPYSIKKEMSDVGESIYALGYPLIGTMGEEVKLTTGIISSRSGFDGDVTNYQISAPIQPGNSGGPVFDESGSLVGIICAKHEGAENVGYAIKTPYLFNLIESVANLNIIPKGNELKGLSLKNQVKLIRDYTFLIKCSK